MTSAQVVETSVTNNSSLQNCSHPVDHTIRTHDDVDNDDNQNDSNNKIIMYSVKGLVDLYRLYPCYDKMLFVDTKLYITHQTAIIN